MKSDGFSSRVKTVPVGALIEDLSIYPRNRVDEFYVSELTESIRAGAELPPPVCDAKSMRIVDGFHRVRAYRRALGAEALIRVKLVDYPDEKSIIAAAIAANTAHGKRLSTCDRIRAIHLAAEAGFTEGEICALLTITEQRLQVLKVRTAKAESEPQRIVPLKRSVVHLAGQCLPTYQIKGVQRAPGRDYRQVMLDIVDGIERDLLPRDEECIKAAALLAEKLAGWLAACEMNV